MFLSEVAGNKWQAPIGHRSWGLGWNPISFFKNILSLQENPPIELTQPQILACLISKRITISSLTVMMFLTVLHYILVSLVCLYVGKNIYKLHGRTKGNTCSNPGLQRKSEKMYIKK